MQHSTGRALDRAVPFDVLCVVFVWAQWPSLAFVSRAFLEVSRSMAVRARYCLAEFGRRRVLDGGVGLAGRRPHMVSQGTVLMLLNLGADPRADDQWILRHACAEGWTPIVRKLLRMRRPPSPQPLSAGGAAPLDGWRGSGSGNGNGGSDGDGQLLIDVHDDDDVALRVAAGLGRTAVVRALVSAGANVEAANGEPLVLAAGNCHAAAVHELLAHGADARTDHSRALRAAVLTGDAALECVQILIGAGADPRAMNDSCLLAACYKGDGALPPPARLDVSLGAPPSRSQLVAHALAGLGEAALGTGAAETPCRHPLRRYRNAASSVNVDALAPPGARPVSHLGVTQLLLALGADACAQRGRPLVYAGSRGSERTAALLLAHGADVHAARDEPLREAAEHGHLGVVRLLLSAGADVSAEDQAPLQAAARGGHVHVVRELLAHGACVRSTCDGSGGGGGGVLALRAAARGGWVAVVHELAGAGADLADGEFRAAALRSRDMRAAFGLAPDADRRRLHLW
ncbi:hypothetical protein IWQ56_000332 [Coemansia nantahalensis]|nr:hypothetical protein IWQ56_000332 [Coemansia nantahalensis]